MSKKAICLVSGGLDSCVTAFLAKKQYDLFVLSFRYGQRHTKELECAKKIAKAVGAKEHIIFDVDLSRFGGSSLLRSSPKPLSDHPLEDIGKVIPSTYVPARNTVFLSLGLAYAETVGAEAIFLGANAVDYSGYPDCRPEFIEAFQRVVALATKKTVEGETIRIEAPLLRLSKAEIVTLGTRLGVPFESTWSCYRGGTRACGRCDSCRLRLKGFRDAKVTDPLPYSTDPERYKVLQ